MDVIDVEVKIDDIVVGRAFRKDMGDIDALAASIAKLGLLQAIGITTDGVLIFGSRRIEAHRQLGRTEIRCRVFEIEHIEQGTHDENEVRKAFTVSERDAIMRVLEQKIGKRLGRPRDQVSLIDRSDLSPAKGTLTRDAAAQRAGLSSGAIAQRVRYIMDNEVQELIDLVDSEELAVDAAYAIAQLEDKDEQRRICGLSARKRKDVVRDLRSDKTKKTKKGKPKPPSKPSKPAPPPRVAPELPTYLPNLSYEEQGFPPRETWEEPDPERPGLTRFQGFIAKHGHVHMMPLHVRQAQDARIATRALSGQVRELRRQPITSFMTTDPAPIDLALLAATLDAMDDAELTVRRLSTLLGEIMPAVAAAYHYLAALHHLIGARASKQPAEQRA